MGTSTVRERSVLRKEEGGCQECHELFRETEDAGSRAGKAAAVRVGQGSMAALLSVAQLAVSEDQQEDGCEA